MEESVESDLCGQPNGRSSCRRCRIRSVKQWLRPTVLTSALACCYIIATMSSKDNPKRVGRHLLSEEKPVWEQCGYEADHAPGAFIFLYTVLIFFLFVGIAILCDDFFVPSLEVQIAAYWPALTYLHIRPYQKPSISPRTLLGPPSWQQVKSCQLATRSLTINQDHLHRNCSRPLVASRLTVMLVSAPSLAALSLTFWSS